MGWNSLIRNWIKECLLRYAVCTAGGTIPCVSSTVTTNACFSKIPKWVSESLCFCQLTISLFSPTALGIISTAIFQGNFLFKFHHYTQLKGFQSNLSGKSSPTHKYPATIHRNPSHSTDVEVLGVDWNIKLSRNSSIQQYSGKISFNASISTGLEMPQWHW